MTLYETIFTRRSVRQYDKAPLDSAAVAKVREVLNNAKQLPGQNAKFEIITSDFLKRCPAPQAILAFANNGAIASLNIGYMLQGVDLYLQSIGLGSVWLGSAKPASNPKDYRIMLAFGKTDVPVRTGERDFKRKAISEISNEDNAIANAARLAPSAVNFQPWKLHFTPGKVTVQSNSRGIGKLLMANFQKIDLGIVLKHIELAIEHEGKSITTITPREDGKTFSVEVSYV
jgi:nitroreductase